MNNNPLINLNFVHVGKCSGTSIKKALQTFDYNYTHHHCADANKQISKLINKQNNCFFLISIRDPIKRYISAFYWEMFEKIMRKKNLDQTIFGNLFMINLNHLTI